MYCPQCSTELPDDSKFCIKCRYDFTRIKTTPSKKQGQDSLDGLGTSIHPELDNDSFAVSTLFANRYEILEEGKKGGMGAVYKCKDTKLNEIVALKVIHPRLLSSSQALSRFRQEVSISRKLQHPNIVRVYNLEEWDGKEYFTMEWVEGVTLREIITKRKMENRPFSIEEAYQIISQLSDALQHAHQFTIHRDIKPENILVPDEKELRVKLTDFGIAKMLSPSQFTSTSMQMGTPYYMAPEQKVDAANIDKRADIYALGVVLFELLTLENTIGLEMPSEINKDLPPVIDNIIKKAVATKPNDRYADAKGLSELLKKTADSSSEQADKSRKEAEELKKREEERLRKEAEDRKQKEVAQKKEQEDKERRIREKEETEQKRIEEQKKWEEDQKQKTLEPERIRIAETSGQRKSFPFAIKAIAAIGVLVIIIGIYVYKSREESSIGPEISSPPVEAPAPQGQVTVPDKGRVSASAPAFPSKPVETEEAEKRQRVAEEARIEAEKQAEEERQKSQIKTLSGTLTEYCRSVLVNCNGRPQGKVCVRIRISKDSTCKGLCADNITKLLQDEGIAARSRGGGEIHDPPACVGARTDIGGTAEGAECLAKFLGPAYKVGQCTSDGYPYNVRLE